MLKNPVQTTPGPANGERPRESRLRPSLAERELVLRTRWLITSRWLAAVGVLVLPLAAHYGFGVGFSVTPVAVVSAAMAAYNGLFLLYTQWLRAYRKTDFRTWVIFANVQICIDLMALTILIHFTGGVENPFLFFYVFHMIISSVLLPPFNAYLQATYATVLFLGLATLESFAVIPHVKLGNYILASHYDRPQVVVGICTALVSSLYLSVYMATSIADSLRRHQAELEEAYRNLEALSATRSVFFREASHELRAPLIAMRSCLDVVLGEHVGAINEKQRDMVQRTHDRIDYLIELVNDLLQLSWLRATTKLVKIERLDISGIVRDVVDLLAENAAEKNVTVTSTSESIEIEGDKSGLHQVVMNLLGNAIKYNRDGGRVEVSGSIKGEAFFLEVKDTGMGIAPEEIDKIFEEFYRTPRAREAVKIGTGVGLAIVKRIVEMHHGEITVESELGAGTTFRVRLPMDQP